MNSGFRQHTPAIVSGVILLLAALFAVLLSLPGIEGWAANTLASPASHHLRHLYLFGTVRLVIVAATLFVLIYLCNWLAGEEQPAKHARWIAALLAAALLFYPLVNALSLEDSLLASAFLLIPIALAALVYSRHHKTILPSPSLSQTSPRWQAWEAGVLLLLFALTLALRSTLYADAYPQDIMAYVTAVDRWVDGARLYQGAWDHKPPLGLAVVGFFVWLFGPSPAAIFALEGAVFAAGLITIYLAARRLDRPTAAVAAVLLWCLIGNDALIEGNRFNMESLIVPCAAWSFYLLLPRRTDDPDPAHSPHARSDLGVGRAYLAGFAFFLCSGFKQVLIVLPILAVLALLCSARDKAGGFSVDRIKGTAFDILRMVLVGLVGWTATFLYFWIAGTFDDFFYATFTYNSQYAKGIIDNLPKLVTIASINTFGYVYLVATYVLACVAALRYPDRRHLLVAAYAIALVFAVIATGRRYGYYVLILTPLLAIVGGAWCARIFADWRAWVLAATAGIFSLTTFAYYDSAQQSRIVHSFGPNRHVEAQRVGLMLKEKLPKGALFFHWGGDPALYFWSGRQAPVPYVYNFPLVFGSRKEAFQDELLAELAVLQPDLIVTRQHKWSQLDHPVLLWLDKEYRFTEAYGSSSVFEFRVPKESPER